VSLIVDLLLNQEGIMPTCEHKGLYNKGKELENGSRVGARGEAKTDSVQGFEHKEACLA